IVTQVLQSACQGDAGLPAEDDTADAGASDFGATMYGSEGDDDDCKYHLKWSATCISVNQTFTVTVAITTKSDGKPLTGLKDGNFSTDLYLTDQETHLAPINSAKYTETSTPGTYTLGPLKFDESGNWTLRFHIRPECTDSEGSPHGHAAFFINVP
ncbi:MAG TPA: hypothetical protein VGI70_07630, partial [Polyangiales bacterium]